MRKRNIATLILISFSTLLFFLPIPSMLSLAILTVLSAALLQLSSETHLIQLDEKDVAILRAVRGGFTTVYSISRETGFNWKTVKIRINELQERGLVSFENGNYSLTKKAEEFISSSF